MTSLAQQRDIGNIIKNNNSNHVRAHSCNQTAVSFSLAFDMSFKLSIVHVASVGHLGGVLLVYAAVADDERHLQHHSRE